MRAYLALRHLYPSVREHREVEADVLRRLRESLPEAYVGRPPAQGNLRRYAERNAFSILFLAVYRALGVPPERRRVYGLVNHVLRGIVTATDNLLDDEYKAMLPLVFPGDARRFKSVMHILLFDRFLAAALEEAVENGVLGRELGRELGRRVFHALLPIGAEEASEERGVEDVLPPAEVLETVHARKGCDLLRLAFVAPRLVEVPLAPRIELADCGVCRIGLALQMVDDLVDVAEDLRSRRHNYLVSLVWHEGSPEEREQMARSREAAGAGARAENFPECTRRVMGRVMEEALGGFASLEGAGFWIGPTLARPLLRRLFYLRGAGSLWDLLPASAGTEEGGA